MSFSVLELDPERSSNSTSEWRVRGREERDLLRSSVLEHDEVFLFQHRNERGPIRRADHAHFQIDKIRVDANSLNGILAAHASEKERKYDETRRRQASPCC